MILPATSYRIAAFLAALLLSVPILRAELVWEHTEVHLQATPLEKEIEAHYPFKNAGTEVVKFKALESSCVCVSMTVSSMAIPPGGTGEVTVKYQPGDRMGAQKRPIVVRFDDAAKSTVMLSLQVEVPTVVRSEPLFVKWERDEKLERKKVTILTDEKYPVKNLRVIPPAAPLEAWIRTIEGSHNFSIELLPGRLDEPQSYKLDVEATLENGLVKRTGLVVLVR